MVVNHPFGRGDWYIYHSSGGKLSANFEGDWCNVRCLLLLLFLVLVLQ